MTLGRGSVMMVLVFVLVHHSEMAHATTYIVGDERGWTFNVAGWPLGKNFFAGDTLVFNYIPGTHDVVVVDEISYYACTTPPETVVYSSGNDQIVLARGANYFICNYVGQCESGMKIVVNAA